MTAPEPFDATFDWRYATRTHTVHESVIPETCPVHGNPRVSKQPVWQYSCGCQWCRDMPDWESGMRYFHWETRPVG
jgi:hypothetical protein